MDLTFQVPEFQRIARRDKKAFFSDQCKEIEENNRMGKTREIVKKIRDTKEERGLGEIGRLGYILYVCIDTYSIDIMYKIDN